MVCNVDGDAVCRRIRVQCHFRMRMRELEGVLKQIHQGGQKMFAIARDRDVGVDLGHSESAASCIRPEGRDALRVSNERSEGKRAGGVWVASLGPYLSQ